MGRNTVDWVREHPVTEGNPSGSAFYFFHSFYPSKEDD
jgi:imidazoleglycerol phosphate synthase glutamine amidotransferase subunit HisH